MAEGQEARAVSKVNGLAPGYYVVGEFLGTKPASSFERNGETINVKPKLGVRTDGGELGIGAASEVALGAALAGIEPGSAVAVRVRVRGPFGSQGPVKFSLADGGEDEGGWK